MSVWLFDTPKLLPQLWGFSVFILPHFNPWFIGFLQSFLYFPLAKISSSYKMSYPSSVLNSFSSKAWNSMKMISNNVFLIFNCELKKNPITSLHLSNSIKNLREICCVCEPNLIHKRVHVLLYCLTFFKYIRSRYAQNWQIKSVNIRIHSIHVWYMHIYLSHSVPIDIFTKLKYLRFLILWF